MVQAGVDCDDLVDVPKDLLNNVAESCCISRLG